MGFLNNDIPLDNETKISLLITRLKGLKGISLKARRIIEDPIVIRLSKLYPKRKIQEKRSSHEKKEEIEIKKKKKIGR